MGERALGGDPSKAWKQRAVFIAYAVVVGIGVAVHEPWWDEAQAWLLARDASLHDLLTRWLAYEGHPPLWYLILMIPAKAGFPYKSINVISALAGIAGVIILLRLRHVPMLLRAAIPFTFYAAYEYTVVSRGYVLIPPLLCAIASFYDRRDRHPIRFAALLSLLSLVSVHGACIAAGLVLLFAVDFWRGRLSRETISFPALMAAASLLAITAASLALVLRPPGDLVTAVIIDRSFRFAKMANLAMLVIAETLLGRTDVWMTALSMVFAALLLYWLHKRGRLLELAVLFAALLPVASMYFARWHDGLFFWAIVFVILLPARETPASTVVDRAGWAIVAVMLAVHCVWTARSLFYDVRFNYTAARDAAVFVRDHGIDRTRLFGAGVRCLELQPYFQKNIFANWSAPGGGAFWNWSRGNRWPYPEPAPQLGEMSRWLQDQLGQRPDYVVTASGFRSDAFYRALLRRRPDYREIGKFRGGLYWKDRVIEGMDFSIFQRVR